MERAITATAKFGAIINVMTKDIDGRGNKALHEEDRASLDKAVEQACQSLVSGLAAHGVAAVNHEAEKAGAGAGAEDFPEVADLSWRPEEILIEGEWFDMEDGLDEDGLFTLTVRIPVMERTDFLVAMKALFEATSNTFADQKTLDHRSEAWAYNHTGRAGLLLLQCPNFSLARFMCSAPEAAGQAASRQIWDFRSTTVRQQAGPALLRDMQLLGRESISPHSIDNALQKQLYEFASAFRVMPDQTVGLKHFSSHSLLTGCTEFTNLPLPGILDRMEHFRIPFGMRASYLDVDPMTDRLLDRLAVALAWFDRHADDVEIVRQMNEGELSTEGSSTMVILFKGEFAMMVSEEHGWVSVPSDENETGGRHFLQKAGFSISDVEVILPLIALDLAEILETPGFGSLPIKSPLFAIAVDELRNDLKGMGLMDPILPDVAQGE